MADEVGEILEEIERADGLVLGAPVNFGTVTAVMKRFIERTICLAYWPWGKAAPVKRDPQRTRQAVVISSAAAPGVVGRMTGNSMGVMKKAASVFGAKTIGTLMVGLAAVEKRQELSARAVRKARRLGRKLAS